MKKKPPNKKKILLRLLDTPDKGKNIFYAKEMKFLNSLCERYSLEFMDIVNFPYKFDSLAYLVSPKLKKSLDEKFRAFNYVFDESRYPKYNIGEKVGADLPIEKKQTLKDFLHD